MDKEEIIRNLHKHIEAIATEKGDVIATATRLNEFYEYVFGLWEDGYEQAQKEGWVKNLN